MKTCDFTLAYNDKEYNFRLVPLKHKEAIKIVHQFIAAIQAHNADVTQIDFDVLSDMTEKLFDKCFILEGTNQLTFADPWDFFIDKIDLWYLCIPEAIRVNAPDFFRKMEGAK